MLHGRQLPVVSRRRRAALLAPCPQPPPAEGAHRSAHRLVRAGGTADGPVIRSADPRDRIEAGLLADEIDLGIAFEGPRAAGITAQALFTEHLSLVVTAHGGDPEAERPLPVARLAEQRLALLSNDIVTRGHIDGCFAEHHVSPPIAVEANSIQALTEIVQRTPSPATVLPDAVTDDHPHLRPVALDPPLPARRVTLLRRDSAYHSAAARAFAEPAAGATHRPGRAAAAGFRRAPRPPGGRWHTEARGGAGTGRR
ncbi:hypothetical protein H0H10_20290 [Streptomyces sp. TRM S81-3]|uniref:LysR substrate-binding domain-containing protein n=1 Tax=Streptomyces griseicoloratus TaxID=2752516 RepID=A0A926L789_9ACTN|nr:LysR substrate-binding domain-containing protein [Streptomyces griseicoloratus]MBD0421467.1 hypothetical protein [Streptomyces griseicoloratus]